MRYSDEIIAQKNNVKYPYASELLYYIKKKEIPKNNVFSNLYGVDEGKYAKDFLERAYSNKKYYYKPGKIRNHDYNAPKELTNKRLELKNYEPFMRTETEILNWEENISPKFFETMFNNYSKEASEFINMTIMLRENRQCGISSACHYHRLAGVAHKLGIDQKKSGKDILAILEHDNIEDYLVPLFEGPQNYDEFIEKHIPKEILDYVETLTNFYDIMINFHKKEIMPETKYVTKNSLLKYYEKIIEKDYKPFTSHAIKAHKLLSEQDFEETQAIYKKIKKMCWYNLYAPNIISTSLKNNDLRPVEGKAIDLSDNGHGAEGLEKELEFKNLNKRIVFSNHISKINYTPTENHLREIAEDALERAEYLIINKLLKQESITDFLGSALLDFRKLQAVFYTNKMPPI